MVASLSIILKTENDSWTLNSWACEENFLKVEKGRYMYEKSYFGSDIYLLGTIKGIKLTA